MARAAVARHDPLRAADGAVLIHLTGFTLLTPGRPNLAR
jgi:hypothetical protein